MARWKARVEFLLSVIELLFLCLAAEAPQGKMCQNSLRSEGGRSLGAKISGGMGRPWGIFFGFYKTRHILLSDSTCRRFNATPACDRHTDGIAVASTALAMWALRHAVKTVAMVVHRSLKTHLYSKQHFILTLSLIIFLLHFIKICHCLYHNALYSMKCTSKHFSRQYNVYPVNNMASSCGGK